MPMSAAALGSFANMASLAGIGGDVMVCEKMGKGKKGKIRCSLFKHGRGVPRGARKSAGVGRPYRYSTAAARKRRGAHAGGRKRRKSRTSRKGKR